MLALFFASCGTVKRGSIPGSAASAAPSPITVESSEDNPSAPAAISAAGPGISRVVQQLHSAHNEWKGTPYLLGGTGMNGIDCSAFTQVVYSEFFGTSLPRNTRRQLSEGQGVRRNNIRPGDLIFFRTGRRTLHVGIAMQNGDFLHASVSGGVMISNLSENYWAGRFLGVRRVL
ncbi:C40 family peptidase [Rhodohalobacter mucosus]|uniref:Hydrolase n=1 Tax=Rhodohalobacter mucosus TaxID=2079485 RepID=A0A316TTV2_9BACT|nr:NlpC/P60 family protein [Rhodohalobacter mucosus]PWN07308.1 hydrolase [Rhodohalobacter mucosus]